MKKTLKMYDRIKSLSSNGGKIYIRGAGKAGQKLCSEMLELGIGIDGFLDNAYDSKPEVRGIPVFNPETIYSMEKNFFIMVAIKDDKQYANVCLEMERHGLRSEADFGDFSNDPDFRMMGFMDITPVDDFYENFKNVAISRLQEMRSVVPSFNATLPDAYNLIPNVDVSLTTFCSLKCKYCSHCIPYANPPKHSAAEEVVADIDKLLSVSYAACIAIMGGEPFIYPQLAEFLKRYAALENKRNIGFTRIVTNGTVVPSDEVFEAYSKIENAYVYISNYGEKSTKIEPLTKKCNEYGIPLFVYPYSDDWVTLGDFNYERKYTEEQLRHLFAVCGSHSCVQLMNGRIYTCGRIPVLNEYGLIPFCETDFCDVRSASPSLLKEELHAYLYEKPYLNGCKYCDGQHAYSEKVGRGD